MSRFFWISFTFLALVGCEKEYSNEFGPGVLPPTPLPTGSLLKSAVLKDDASELRYLYDYDAGKLMIKNTGILTSPFLSGDFTTSVSRDATGKIQSSQLVFRTTLNPLGDTVFYSFFRNASGKVAYSLVRSSLINISVGYDSIVYTYSSGKITGSISYLIDVVNRTIEPYQKFEFTYSGANVTKAVDYELSGSLSNQKVVETITMEYDTKPAAYALSEDDYLAGLIPINLLFPCTNNITKVERTYEDPDENNTTTYLYTYGNNNRPATAEVTTTQVGLPATKGTLTFTYQ